MPIMDLPAIREILPHRYPMLLVDRIVELEEERIVGIKNVTANEPFFLGHFPDFPVMPGVLIVEAMAQVAGVLVLSRIPDRHSKLVLLASIEQAKFRKPVVPGDQLRIEMIVTKIKTSVAKMHGTATVDGVVVAEAEVLCKIADRPTLKEETPMSIHPSAIVDPGAHIAESAEIGPLCRHRQGCFHWGAHHSESQRLSGRSADDRSGQRFLPLFHHRCRAAGPEVQR